MLTIQQMCMTLLVMVLRKRQRRQSFISEQYKVEIQVECILIFFPQRWMIVRDDIWRSSLCHKVLLYLAFTIPASILWHNISRNICTLLQFLHNPQNLILCPSRSACTPAPYQLIMDPHHPQHQLIMHLLASLHLILAPVTHLPFHISSLASQQLCIPSVTHCPQYTSAPSFSSLSQI